MDIIPLKLVRPSSALFSKAYVRRLLNLERDTTISADTLTMFATNDMVDHVSALYIMKERFELTHLHLLALQRCNKQSQLGSVSPTSYTRVKSVALTLDGFHISSWLYRLIKLMVNLQRFPDAYNPEKREVENAVYTVLLTLDPSYFDAEEVFFIWQLAALCSSWTQIKAMTEHFALRDALETLSSEQFAEILNLLCNTRHNKFTPEDEEAFVQLKARYPTLTREEEKQVEVKEQRQKLREACVQAYSWERTRSNPVVQSMCVADEVEAFLQDKCVMVSHGYRILREVIGEKYAWERCIEVLRDTSLDAMFARERIISVLPVLASSTEFWPSVELDPKYHHPNEEEEEKATASETHEQMQEEEEGKEQEHASSNASSKHQDSTHCVNNTNNTSTNTNTDITATTNNKVNTHLDTCVMNAETNKAIRAQIKKLYYKPVVHGTPGRGATLYQELPWLFDEKSWRSYFPVNGSNGLHELYTISLNQFALRLASVYGNVNITLPNYVRESYEKPIEANLWRHICERDVDTVGQFALMSIRRFDLIHAPFVFSEQLRKHMEHVVRDRWGVVLSKTNEKEKESSNSNKVSNSSSISSSYLSTNNGNSAKEIKMNANTKSMENVLTRSNVNVEGQESDSNKQIASEVNNNNNNNNCNKEELLNMNDKNDAQHDNSNETQEPIKPIINVNDNNSTEEANSNTKKKDDKVDNINKENSFNGSDNTLELSDDMEYDVESEPMVPTYIHGAKQRELREQRMALRRLSRSTHHHILKTLLIAVEVQCSLEVIKPLLHTLINMMQQILTPSVCHKWNTLYAQRVPLAQDECRIDWPTIEALMNKVEENTHISNNTNSNSCRETKYEINKRFNNDMYVSSDLYARPIDLEWSMWSFAHTAYTLTMMESCFHGKPILPTDIRGIFYKECNQFSSGNNQNIILAKTISNTANEKGQLYDSFPPLMNVKCDAEAAAMKTQLDKLCLASLRGAIATDRITARSVYSILACAPQTLREMKMMYEFLSLAALHARDGFNRSQLFYFVHADHIVEADEKWRRHMLRAALDLPIRMWM